MSEVSLKGVIPSVPSPVIHRALADLPADIAAVKALTQGAINVEMFTLPLYMCAMQSIQGTHEINAQGTTYYQGRVWPGMSTTAPTPGIPLTPNQQAYNSIFSVFIQEMLHLQLAANLAAVLGAEPKFFNGTLLQNSENGWGCYGPGNTVIPHIIDLQDTTSFSNVKVNLDGLSGDQIALFLAIEQSHDAARKDINPGALNKYFPAVPFAGWTAQSTEANLPLFGTIGWMYNCLLNYLAIEYTDSTTLWQHMFNADNLSNQRDLFNTTSSGHQPEYPLMPAQITLTDTAGALNQAIDIIKGICDQGEGGNSADIESFRLHFQRRLRASGMTATDNYVQPQFQPDKAALEADYPSYTDTGTQAPVSADAAARSSGDIIDHWQRFENLLSLVTDTNFMTWEKWFAAGNVWTENDLKTADYDPAKAATNIPTPGQVAAALNEMKTSSRQQLSLVVTGAIAGINTVLTDSWGDSAIAFPYPSMSGSGDRMSLYWAVFGEAPDLSQGTSAPSADLLYHACQGLDYNKAGASCAAMEVYHTCRGSNSCKAQGGCGFAQLEKGGGGCGAMRSSEPKLHAGNLCGQPANYSAPNDNKCKTFGGCAVPISASQLYPSDGTMSVQDVIGGATSPLGTLAFNVGDSVFDTAWAAYTRV
ncbi:MAG: ferritin-like domain-containing protein, partial [Gallionella sp.]